MLTFYATHIFTSCLAYVNWKHYNHLIYLLTSDTTQSLASQPVALFHSSRPHSPSTEKDSQWGREIRCYLCALIASYTHQDTLQKNITDSFSTKNLSLPVYHIKHPPSPPRLPVSSLPPSLPPNSSMFPSLSLFPFLLLKHIILYFKP